MHWVKVADKPMPKDKQFLAIWKGSFCIAEYDDDDNLFWICSLPAQYDAFKVSKERENKFSYWAELIEPLDE